MPTIDQLEAAVVAADDDHLPVSQSGFSRRITRSQLLAGTQSALNLNPGLLGRVSPGLGPPETIAVGSGLSLSGGVLTGVARFSTEELAQTPSSSLDDRLPISQGGRDYSVSVGTLLSTRGVDVSDQVVRSAAGLLRPLEAWLTDLMSIEAFGAVGDGMTDDSFAFRLALSSGRPIVLGPKTYRVDGQWSIQDSVVLIGTPNLTRVLRYTQSGGAWLSVSAPRFVAAGVCFDAGSIGGDSWGVLLEPTCTTSVIRGCIFQNATGFTLGSGLTIQARDGLAGQTSSHTITDCVFLNNSVHGLWVQAASGAEVRGCTAIGNGRYGICFDFNDANFQQRVRQSTISNCRCINNERGISVGNYNETNLEPPRWGLENPDATDIIVANNVCTNNSRYGVAVSGARLSVSGNQIITEAGSPLRSGILCNASSTVIFSNKVYGAGQFGIDAGGCADTSIEQNTIEGFAIGINGGGSLRGQIVRNHLTKNDRAITIFQVETDGAGSNFGLACSDMIIAENFIELSVGQGGIYLLDGPDRICVSGNRFTSAASQAEPDFCWAHSDTLTFERNHWNGLPSYQLQERNAGQLSQAVVPEIFDTLIVDPKTVRVDAIVSPRSALVAGQLTFIRVLDGGHNYTLAQVVIGGAGAGASATAYIRDGIIIGIAVLAPGNGYDRETTTATIIGDGEGASVLPYVGLPNSRTTKKNLINSSRMTLSQRSSGELGNWTGSDISVPANSMTTCLGAGYGWSVIQFTNSNHLSPNTDGSVTLASLGGYLMLRAGPNFGTQMSSVGEPVGFNSLFGRGSPEMKVAAPPGSDYRNLDGGVGITFWVKRIGTDTFGWFPIA